MARATPAEAKTAKAPAKKTSAAKATAPKTPKAPKATTTAEGEKRGRTPGGDRGWLAVEIDKRLRKATGPVTVRELSQDITNAQGNHPSSGAVAAALTRWFEQGYIELTGGRPQAFKRFTPKYKNKTLADFLSDLRDGRKTERAAAKAKATKAA